MTALALLWITYELWWRILLLHLRLAQLVAGMCGWELPLPTGLPIGYTG